MRTEHEMITRRELGFEMILYMRTSEMDYVARWELNFKWIPYENWIRMLDENWTLNEY